MRAINANNSSTSSGESPSEGSSRIISAARPSARGRWQASAARRPTSFRRAALAARRAAGRSRTRARGCHAPRSPAPIAAEIEILSHRQIGKDAAALRHVDKPARDDLRRFLPLDRDAVEMDRAGARAHHTRKRAVERRLADAVGTEHGDDLAGLDARGRRRAALRSRRSRRRGRAPRAAVQRPCAASSFAAAPWPR